MKIWFLPLESLHERYTEQMYRWVVAALDKAGIPHQVVLPPEGFDEWIAAGQWLDTHRTIQFKASQIEVVADLFRQGLVKDGDVFLLGDVWFPGIEAIRFMADLDGIKVRIFGWHYAGCFDPADLLANKLGAWGPEWETVLLTSLLDGVCVGSKFHAGLLKEGVRLYTNSCWGEVPPCPIYPYGLAWDPAEVRAHLAPEGERERIVVFPHRLAPEKNPEAFYQLAEEFGGVDGWHFVVSTSASPVRAEHLRREMPNKVGLIAHPNKTAYYRYLARCSIFYSAATQETFGYALHESIALGLSVVAPNRCSYTEGLRRDRRFLYDTDKDPIGRELLVKRMANPTPVPYEYTARYANSTAKFLAAIEGRRK